MKILVLFAATCLVTSGVQGAVKMLGEECESADTCLDNAVPTILLVCDPVLKTCAIQQDKSCASPGYDQYCVTGSACSSSSKICTCDARAYRADTTSGTCIKKNIAGDACSGSGQGDCSDVTLVCSNGVCVCAADKKLEPTTGICSTAITNGQVGKSCTSGDKDTTCRANLDCIIASGDSQGVCQCIVGKTGDCSADIAAKLVGRGCDTGNTSPDDTNCDSGNNLKCSEASGAGNCVCDNSFGVPGGKCVAAATGDNNKNLGEVCTSTDTCSNHNDLEAACDPVTGTCVLKADQACTGDGLDNYCPTGATCTGSSKACTCDTTVYEADSGTGLCKSKIAAKIYGSACTDTDNCGDSSSFVCTDNICQCATDKALVLSTGICSTNIADELNGNTCTAADESTDCGNDANCVIATGTSGVCQCKPGFTSAIGAACAAIPKLKIGKACSPGTANSSDKCGATAITNLECPSSVCTCKSGYYGVPGGTCAISLNMLGGYCTKPATGSGQGTCSDSNNVCDGALGTTPTCQIAIGKPCTSSTSDNCYSVGSKFTTCDAFTSTCLLKHGQSCKGNEDNCVTGAKCDSKTKRCACDTKSYTNYNGVCKPRDGVNCRSAECDTDLNCDAVAKVCARAVGIACKSGNKCTTGAFCDKDKTSCQCKTPYTELELSKTCVKNTGLDKECKISDKCTQSGLKSELTCDIVSYKCKIKVDEDCSKNTGSCVTGAFCSSEDDNVCKCNTGYVENTNNKICRKEITGLGSSCVHEDVSKCLSGEESIDDENVFCDHFIGKCALKQGKSCENNKDGCGSGAKCTDDNCECVEGFSSDNDNMCIGSAGIFSGSCDPVTKCTTTNSECFKKSDTGRFCVCKEGFSFSTSTLKCVSNSGEISAVASLLVVIATFFASVTGLN